MKSQRLITIIVGLPMIVMTSCTAEDRPSQTARPPGHHNLNFGTEHISLGGEVGPITFGSGRLVYPSSSRPGVESDQVTTLDAGTHRRSVVARTVFKAGYINWAAQTAGWVVYVDQSAMQEDAKPNVLWRVIAFDPRTHEKRILDSNGTKPDPFVPTVKSQGTYVSWAAAEADRSARVVLWKPDWSAPRVVLRHASFGPGSETVVGNAMIYVGPAVERKPGEETRGDCWRVPITGGTPAPLTDTGLVMECLTDGNRLVWSEHIDPKTDKRPVNGFYDNPYEIWSAKGDDKPVLIHRGYMTSWAPYAGDGLVAWVNQEDQVVVESLDDRRVQTVIDGGDLDQGPAGDGTSLVLVTSDGSKSSAEIITPRAE